MGPGGLDAIGHLHLAIALPGGLRQTPGRSIEALAPEILEVVHLLVFQGLDQVIEVIVEGVAQILFPIPHPTIDLRAPPPGSSEVFIELGQPGQGRA